MSSVANDTPNNDNYSDILFFTLYKKLWHQVKEADDFGKVQITKIAREKAKHIKGIDDGEKPINIWEFTISGEIQEQILFIR